MKIKIAWLILALVGCLGAVEKAVFQQGIEGYAGTFDRLIVGDDTAVDGSAVETYFLDGDPYVEGSSVSEDRSLLLRFDSLFGSGAGQIPAGATILSARLVMNTAEAVAPDFSSPASGPFVIGQLDESVDGSTLYSELTEIDLPGARGAVLRPVSAGFVGIKSLEEVTADVSSIVRNWQNGASNNGFAIYTSYTTDSWEVFASGSANVALRPRLEVEYLSGASTIRTFEATRSAVLDSSPGDPTLDGSLITGGYPLDSELDDIREALFAFDDLFGNGAEQIPSGEVIVKAELILTTRQYADEPNTGADSLDVFGVFPMLMAWDLNDDDNNGEVDLDFGATGPSISGGDIDCAVAEFSGIGEDSMASADVTQLVREWQGGQANHGVNVKMTSSELDSWYLTWPGTTGPDGPRLVVTTVSSLPAGEGGEVEFQDGMDGYQDTFQMRIDIGGGRRFPEDFTQYGLDGHPDSSGGPEDASDLLRFDNIVGSGSQQIPAGATVLSAQLEYSTSGGSSSAASGGPYAIGQLDTAVTSSTTYSDLSGVGAGREGVRGSLVQQVAGYSRMNAGQRVSAEVSAIVQDWVDGAANHGFGVYSALTSDGWTVGTRCDILERRPALKVRYVTTPTESLGAVANVIAVMEEDGDITDDGTLSGFSKVDADVGAEVQILLKFENLFGEFEGQLQPEDEVLQAWLVTNTGDLSGDDCWGPVEVREMTTPWSVSSVWSDFGADGPSEDDGETGPVLGQFFGMGILTECRIDITETVKSWQVNGLGEGLILQSRTGDSWWMEMPGSDPFRAPRILVTIGVESGFASWAAEEGLPGLAPDNDDDGDGYEALVEYGLGLDPEVFEQGPELLESGSQLELVFTKGADAKVDGAIQFTIEGSDDLESWVPEASAVDGVDTISLSVIPGSNRFYRLVVTEG